MDPAFYTVIAALGGISITQVSNYFIENQKIKNQIKLKEIELEKSKQHHYEKEKREIYALYLERIDTCDIEDKEKNNALMKVYYQALLLANEETRNKIAKLFRALPDAMTGKMETVDFRNLKKEAVNQMHSELDGH